MATIKGEDTRRRRPSAGKRAEEAAPSGGATTGAPEERSASETQPPADGQAGMGIPTPEAALGLWMSWMKQNMGGFAPVGSTEQPWWVASADAVSGSLLATGVEQFQRFVAADPMLASIDRMWNANPLREVIPVDWAEAVRALRIVWLRSLRDPAKAFTRSAELNMQIWSSAMETWNSAGARWWGLTTGTAPETGTGSDKRFDAPEWNGNPVYKTLKEMYLLASDFLLRQGMEDEDMDPQERERITFHLRQFVDAMSPSLLLMSNPVALRRAVETGGASLADGARNLLHDLREGRLSMVDATAFEPGRNLAVTPGKVVLRNRLIELIQYSPSTEQVRQVPILIMPPWINKFYILDMQPKNSMVKYLVDQGFTVFMVSWKNPDASMEDITFEDYMNLGPLAAADAVRDITGSDSVNPVGYCIGGSLLAMTLSYLAAEGDTRFGSATFMVSMQDFSRVGDSAFFMDEPQIDFIEQQMMERGYLDSREMANMFNLLRSNDLIWSNVVNNYLLGGKPPAFDLLYWNSDGTRMARAAHSWYLRNTYVENNLVKPGKIQLAGVPIDLGKVKVDIYAVGAEKDHIVPWNAAWKITQLTGGDVRFVMASSGHIAGIINHPAGKKGGYSVREGARDVRSPEAWLEGADKQPGSWWPDWVRWLNAHAGDMVPAPALGSDKYPVVCNAPGTYVLEK
ncbi:class I poly(R)-hydroxyalkanoic acid synthase [Skermanella aerolata]|uniref:Class I poly(R)-hydroxyalkanoic acid synthase n=1 Tax=Skermanella aerolata TaxID=393310 RepID=A0A512DHD6_9PROT|nr:class I poly(R)-hydroxyalkanoic acid synthase [Skermanella aerolata]KJB94083.1 hydroxyalkanoic acid synthase [Skermanella aerolata KACC 11604]GEO35898.1 class I poly(R)-hydroxyalkanoic acid synthase [Skermanella aerolata]